MFKANTPGPFPIFPLAGEVHLVGRGTTPLIKGPIPPVRGKWPKDKGGRDDVERSETEGMGSGPPPPSFPISRGNFAACERGTLFPIFVGRDDLGAPLFPFLQGDFAACGRRASFFVGAAHWAAHLTGLHPCKNGDRMPHHPTERLCPNGFEPCKPVVSKKETAGWWPFSWAFDRVRGRR